MSVTSSTPPSTREVSRTTNSNGRSQAFNWHSDDNIVGNNIGASPIVTPLHSASPMNMSPVRDDSHISCDESPRPPETEAALASRDPRDTVRCGVPVTRRAGRLKSAMTHSQARDATCVLCWRKSDRILSENIAVNIREFTHNNELDLDNPSHPGGICNSCRTYLSMVKSDKLGKRKDPRKEWRENTLSTIVIPDTTVTTDVCALVGCPICRLARFNPVGKNGKKSIVHNPVMDPIAVVLDAEIQPIVEPEMQGVRCLTCAAPTGPGLPHPDCPGNKGGRNKVKKERKEARRKKVEKEVERRSEENNNIVIERGNNARFRRSTVARKNILRDLLLQQTVKAQQQIMCDMLSRMGADQNLKDCFKLELTRPQGGEPLQVQYMVLISIPGRSQGLLYKQLC